MKTAVRPIPALQCTTIGVPALRWFFTCGIVSNSSINGTLGGTTGCSVSNFEKASRLVISCFGVSRGWVEYQKTFLRWILYEMLLYWWLNWGLEMAILSFKTMFLGLLSTI